MGVILELVDCVIFLPTVQISCLQSPQNMDSGLCFLLLIDLSPQNISRKGLCTFRSSTRTRSSGESEGSLIMPDLEDDLFKTLITVHTALTANRRCHSIQLGKLRSHSPVELAKFPSRCGQENFFFPGSD